MEKLLIENKIDSLEKLIYILDHSYDGIVLSDKEGRIFFATQAIERITGGRREDLYGKKLSDLLAEGLILNDKRNISNSFINLSHKTKTGVEVFITSIPVYDSEGNFLCFVANYREMEQLKEIQKQLEETAQKKDSYYRELCELRNRLLSQEDVVVKSAPMRIIMETLIKFSPAEVPILITGESGVGKGVIARLIHRMSPRNKGPFVEINCAAIPENLLEAELFGYEKGAFTGAGNKGKPGLFEVAQGGTILLDEITEMSPPLQAKLLQAIQERQIFHIGGLKPIKLDVRILCSTNQDIKEMIRKGRFREDLFYRINVIPIHIPPLKERQEDIIPLACYFLEKYNKKYNKRKSFSQQTCECLEKYSWPGNVRELENLVERLVILVDEEKIYPEDLPDNMVKSSFMEPRDEEVTLRIHMEKKEREFIQKVLTTSRGIRHAARRLGINHSTLINKIRKYGLKPPPGRSQG